MSYPKKKWGQNFLIDNNIINKIISTANPKKDSPIIEIGAGNGALTLPLSNIVSDLKAVEIDPTLSQALIDKKIPNTEVINCDFLKYDLNYTERPLSFIGNLPYNITSPIIFKIIHNSNWEKATIMVQDEVADRIVAYPRSKSYGRLSVMVQALSQPNKIFTVSNNCFFPKPKVQSAIITLKSKITNIEDFNNFSEIVRIAFVKRRKILNNSLGKVLNDDSIDGYRNMRPEELSVQDFIKIHKRNLLNKIK